MQVIPITRVHFDAARAETDFIETFIAGRERDAAQVRDILVPAIIALARLADGNPLALSVLVDVQSAYVDVHQGQRQRWHDEAVAAWTED